MSPGIVLHKNIRGRRWICSTVNRFIGGSFTECLKSVQLQNHFAL